jgi:superfamily I DNA and/or RNA helicase
VYGDENAFRWPNDDSPVALIDVAGTEDRQGTSHTNQNEALTALDVIMSLLRTCRIEGVPVQCSSIGLVTP